MDATQVWCEDLKGKHLSYGQMKVHSPTNSGQRRLTPGGSGTKVPGPPGTLEDGVPPMSSRPRWLSPKIPTAQGLVPESNTVLEPCFLCPRPELVEQSFRAPPLPLAFAGIQHRAPSSRLSEPDRRWAFTGADSHRPPGAAAPHTRASSAGGGAESRVT